MFIRVFFILLLHVGATSFAQPREVVYDFTNDWKEDRTKNTDVTTVGYETAHLLLDLKAYPGSALVLKSASRYYIFVNGKLSRATSGETSMPIDSLRAAYTNRYLSVAIHQPGFNRREFSARILGAPQNDTALLPRGSAYFRDFVAAAGLLLIIIFIVLIRINSKLTFDYFSILRVLSLRDTEDNPSHSRVAFSSNIGFYIFASLLLGYLLLITFTMLPEGYQIKLAFLHDNFLQACGRWLILSGGILILLLTKLVVSFALANLFGMPQIAGAHFLNWVRLILVVSSTLSVITFALFINRKYDAALYGTLLTILATVFTLWIVQAFLKLGTRSQHTMFHLFSYICATEVIPLLIMFKVLYT